MNALPIDPMIPAMTVSLERTPNLVLLAPPGAGKTTRLPPAIMESGRGAVLLLQPRRVAARAAASRIAEEQGWRIGNEIGWVIRFENRCGPRTRLKVLTEGILTRMIQSDPALEGVGCVILDEFHERGIHTDMALAFLREVQATIRPELRIIVMSATMDAAPVARFLSDGRGAPAPVFESEGRLHPVEIGYLEKPDEAPVWERAARAAKSAMASAADDGHILVFLPGIGEIRRTRDLIGEINGEIHILHSSVSAEEQDRALRPSTCRKLILATNIAETSITIDGVRTVIDSGLARVARVDARIGIDRLELRRISRASARQRAGRAGRTEPGRCIRLWTRAEDLSLDEYDTPEIHRVDLAGPLLSLFAFGAGDPGAFPWFDPPKPESVQRAVRLLELLGAIEPRGKSGGGEFRITKPGSRLAALPLHPRIGRMLLAGAGAGLTREAATMAALLSERDIFGDSPGSRRRAARHEADSDLIERLDALRTHDPALDRAAVQAVLRTRDALLQYGISQGGPASPAGHHDALLKALLLAYPDRLAARRAGDSSRGVMVGGRAVVLEHSSVVRKSPFFLALDAREAQTGPGGATSEIRVTLASAVEEAWIEELFPHLLTTGFDHRFDPASGRVMSFRQRRFGDLVIHEAGCGANADPEGAARELVRHLDRDPRAVFESDPAAAALLARVGLLRGAMPELDLPDLGDQALGGILARAARGCASLDQLRRIGLGVAIENTLNPKLRHALDREAPESLTVPSGSRIKLLYEPGAAAPVMPVRLQEVFGLGETPRIAAGRVAVVMQLLGPNHRPVQTTRDLKNFWNTTYKEIRRELKIKYPKHPWPEDPWNAPAVAVGRRRR